jgi:hypothetical protein
MLDDGRLIQQEKISSHAEMRCIHLVAVGEF